MIDLKNLNEMQLSAVENIKQPQMVIAGAGSGKTRVLTYKIAYLIKKEKYKADSILALTFTNKAAQEMKDRIADLVGKKANQIWMGTFHSIFARILRIESKFTEFENNFSIYDTEDSQSLVNNIINNFDIDIEGVTASSVRHKISYMKNHMVMPDEFRKNHAKGFIEEKIADIYDEYQKRLLANNAMDFDDLLLKPIELFKTHKSVLQKYKKKFSYILVDEFQDTNKAQYELIKLFVTRNCKISVVGDDAQSIYSWRGANLDNMLNFKKDYPKHKIFKLEQNYRSTKTILKAADSVIKNNQEQLDKTLWTENEDGEKISVIKCADEKDEAHQIAKYIKKEITRKKLSHKDFTVLYRTNAQSRVLEDIFRKEKLPY
ncbi:MAG: UvrD-helicase domain-containing protein, partial [Ignavibacteria bacterium]